MQAGAGARPDYANKRLAAVKRMKKKWEGGWDECMRLKELEVRAFPSAPAPPPSLQPSHPPLDPTSFSCLPVYL